MMCYLPVDQRGRGKWQTARCISRTNLPHRRRTHRDAGGKICKLWKGVGAGLHRAEMAVRTVVRVAESAWKVDGGPG